MPHRTFFFFMLPSSLAMLLFFVPIFSVLYQSFLSSLCRPSWARWKPARRHC